MRRGRRDDRGHLLRGEAYALLRPLPELPDGEDRVHGHDAPLGRPGEDETKRRAVAVARRERDASSPAFPEEPLQRSSVDVLDRTIPKGSVEHAHLVLEDIGTRIMEPVPAQELG